MPQTPTNAGRHADVLRVFQSKQEIKAFYNKISKIYDLMAERSEEPMRKAGLEKLAVVPGESVLEIGFGTGHCLAELAERVGPLGTVYGIDLSEEMTKLAQRLLQEKSLAHRALLTCDDAELLPYAAESKDAVFMSFTLELFDTPVIPKVLAECKRVLRPSGRIAVVGMSKEGRSTAVLRTFEWTHRHFPNLLDCRPIYVRKALEDSGFEIRDATLKHMWVPVEVVLARKV